MANNPAIGGIRLGVSCLCAAGTVLGLGGTASAELADCPPMTVEANRALLADWPELPEQIEDRFASRRAIDPCARVRLEQRQGAIAVHVALNDGRVASRSVRHGDDVIPVLDALLLVPESPASTEAATETSPLAATELSTEEAFSHPPATPKDEPADRVLEPEPADTPNEATDETRSRVSVELGALGDVRAGDLPSTFALGVRPMVRLWRVLLGAELRARGSSEGTAAEFSALVGYRFPVGSLELDVLAGPYAEIPGDTRASEPAPPTMEREIRSEDGPSLYFGTHLRFAPTKTLSGFAGLEATVGVVSPDESGVNRPTDSNVWMGGVVLGATVGTR
jgi:hypothetical protein